MALKISESDFKNQLVTWDFAFRDERHMGDVKVKFHGTTALGMKVSTSDDMCWLLHAIVLPLEGSDKSPPP